MNDNVLEFDPSKDDLEHLREWIGKSPHIIQDYDDTILSAFVRACKGSLQKTKKVLEAFNALGQRYPAIIKNYDPLDQPLVDHLSQTMIFTLPKKTPNGSIVYIGMFRDYEGFKIDPSKSHTFEFYRYWLLSLYIYLWRNDFGSGNWIIIVDCKGMTLSHGREFTPVLVKQGLEIMQSGLPIRLEAVHILNIPPYMEYVFNLSKSLAKKKLSERMYFHSKMETFHQKIPKEILPEEYGGCEKNALLLHERWFGIVKSFRENFLEEEKKMRELDPLRPKTDDTQEMVGTFRALNVD